MTDQANLSPRHPRNITESYTYDPDNRLISATGPYGVKIYLLSALSPRNEFLG